MVTFVDMGAVHYVISMHQFKPQYAYYRPTHGARGVPNTTRIHDSGV